MWKLISSWSLQYVSLKKKVRPTNTEKWLSRTIICRCVVSSKRFRISDSSSKLKFNTDSMNSFIRTKCKDFDYNWCNVLSRTWWRCVLCLRAYRKNSKVYLNEINLEITIGNEEKSFERSALFKKIVLTWWLTTRDWSDKRIRKKRRSLSSVSSCIP